MKRSNPPGGRLFPFLFGGTFIEGSQNQNDASTSAPFPFLFGGTFIEGSMFHKVL